MITMLMLSTMVRFINKNRVNIDKNVYKNEDDKMKALYYSNKEILNILLEVGANVNDKDEKSVFRSNKIVC